MERVIIISQDDYDYAVQRLELALQELNLCNGIEYYRSKAQINIEEAQEALGVIKEDL